MISIPKTIFTGMAPNIQSSQVWNALALLVLPWKWSHWKKGNYTQTAERLLSDYLQVPHVVSVDSGRTALYAALLAGDIQPGDEVLVQAYTCMVVINAIRWTGATPVYLDILPDFTIDPAQVAQRISSKTKALIIQHSFGTPANIADLIAVAKKHNLFTIEDAAHSLGARYSNGKQTGTVADIGIFSFGSDKVISCARGGAAVTASETYALRLRSYQQSLPQTTAKRIAQHLLHFPIMAIGKRLYSWGVGKWLLYIAQQTSIINKIIYKEEKKGQMALPYPAQFPNALALLLIDQLSRIDKINTHRRHIAAYYAKTLQIASPIANHPNSIFLRYPLLVQDPKQYHSYAKTQHILLGNWYDTVIAPRDSDMSSTGYKNGSCPNAEMLAAQSINLPTHEGISQKDAEKIVTVMHHIYDRNKTNT